MSKKEWYNHESLLVEKYVRAIETVLTLDSVHFGLLSEDTSINLNNLSKEYVKNRKVKNG